MKLKFKDVLPNPRRDLKRNPLKREKIEELVTSINTTGFWDNVLTRKNKAGKYELAYGHHRVQAAIEAGLESADFIVKDLSDALMIQIMDNENREVYGSSPASLIESVRAVVEALDEGSIPPFDIDPKTRKEVIHYAPSYVPNNDEDVSSKPSQKAYTAKHIAVFLGRTVPNEEGREGVRAPDEIKAALRALGLKELGHFSDSMLITKDRTGSPKPITTKEFVKITGDITRDVVKVQERQGKTRQELETLRAEQLEIQAKAKADKKSADEAEKKRIKEISAAREEENFKKAEALAAKLKKEQEERRNVEERNKAALKAFEEKLAQKKAWEAEQRIVDAYAPIRRDVEAFISKYETKISERNPEREEIKSLAKRKGLRPEDLARAQRALRDYANWLYDWALPQLMPSLKAEQKQAVEKRKEKK